MSINGYLFFLKNMGHKVKEVDGGYWFNAHPGIYVSLPFQKMLVPSEVNVKRILRKDGIALRYPCDEKYGRASYRISINDSGYSLASLNGKSRNQTRRGLENCVVKPVEFDLLFEQAVKLNKETLVRQGRRIPSGFDEYWLRYYREAAKAEGAEAWGAFIDGELAAYLIAFRMEAVAHILIVRSAREMLSRYPNNALIFSYVSSAMHSGEVGEVSIGYESIQGGMASLDKFKTGMGFKKIVIGQRVEFSPLIAPIARSPFGRLVKSMSSRLADKNEKVAKLSGLLDWYQTQEKPSV